MGLRRCSHEPTRRFFTGLAGLSTGSHPYQVIRYTWHPGDFKLFTTCFFGFSLDMVIAQDMVSFLRAGCSEHADLVKPQNFDSKGRPNGMGIRYGGCLAYIASKGIGSPSDFPCSATVLWSSMFGLPTHVPIFPDLLANYPPSCLTKVWPVCSQ